MQFTVAVRTESQSVFGRILAPVGQRCPVVNFEEWSPVRFPHKRCVFPAPLANPVCTNQHRHDDIGISSIANRNYLNTLRNPRSRSQPLLKCIWGEVSRTLNFLGEFQCAGFFRLRRGNCKHLQISPLVNLAPPSRPGSFFERQSITFFGQHARRGQSRQRMKIADGDEVYRLPRPQFRPPEQITFFGLKCFQITQNGLASFFRKVSFVFPSHDFCRVTNLGEVLGR